MHIEQLIHRISNLSIWKKNGQRAPHKPLLILYALGQYQNYRQIKLPYEEVREPLRRLLIEFGPPRKSYHPEEPFARLVSDEIWSLNVTVDLKKNIDRQLLTSGAVGGFSQEVIPRICFSTGTCVKYLEEERDICTPSASVRKQSDRLSYKVFISLKN